MVSLRIDSNSVATVRSSVNHIGNAVAGISFAGVESDGCGDSKVRLDVSYLTLGFKAAVTGFVDELQRLSTAISGIETRLTSVDSALAAYLDGRKLPDKQVHAGKMTGTPLTE